MNWLNLLLNPKGHNMFDYKKIVKEYEDLKNQNPNIYKNINPVSAARMRLQNRFHTGLDIAQYTADIMHADMADYDKDSSVYTQSLGCWHGFTAQQVMMEIKRSHKTTSKRYVYLRYSNNNFFKIIGVIIILFSDSTIANLTCVFPKLCFV